MELPKKDKHNISYLSYSQISTFKRSPEDYYNQYILNMPFEGNEYTSFGTKVGEALEKNDYSLFSENEKRVLTKAKRLDVFERKTILEYDGFYVIGFIDSLSYDFTEILDYKTGGVGKNYEYSKDDYYQLQIYALSIRQETGITPQKGTVQFITRGGNINKGESLQVKNTPIIEINIDLSIERLRKVYWGVLNTAKQISQFYKDNKIKTL
jgi:hypothetical protein